MLEDTVWFLAQIRLSGDREWQTVGLAASRADAARRAGYAYYTASRSQYRPVEARVIKTAQREIPTLSGIV